MEILPDSTLDVLSNLVKPGSASDYGCPLGKIEEWKFCAKNLSPGKRIVAVDRWIWWDLQFSEEHGEIVEQFEHAGIQPATLFANNIIFDTSRRPLVPIH